MHCVPLSTAEPKGNFINKNQKHQHQLTSETFNNSSIALLSNEDILQRSQSFFLCLALGAILLTALASLQLAIQTGQERHLENKASFRTQLPEGNREKLSYSDISQRFGVILRRQAVLLLKKRNKKTPHPPRKQQTGDTVISPEGYHL